MTDHPREAAKLLLSSMHKQRHPDRRLASFFITRPGQHPYALGEIRADVYIDSKKLLACALYIQDHGESHLRGLPLSTIQSELVDFVTENYYLLASETLFRDFPGAYAENVSTNVAAAFSAALAESRFFVEPRLDALFPLVPIKVAKTFASDSFYLCAPADLISQMGEVANRFDIVEDTFPPIANWDGLHESTSSWLGVRAPTIEAARKIRAAVLGAVALLPHHHQRYQFSGRKMFGGEAMFSVRWEMSFDDPLTPPLMSDVVIDGADHAWLSEIARKLTSSIDKDQRHIRSLEYYYSAWVPDPVKRFPTLFAVLDAIFGDPYKSTQVIVDAVSPLMGAAFTFDRVRLIMGLRNSVIHGGAPNIYESSKYRDYYRAYGEDAASDMELIVARCLQQVIFPGTMTERPHTHAEEILRRTGRVV